MSNIYTTRRKTKTIRTLQAYFISLRGKRLVRKVMKKKHGHIKTIKQTIKKD